MFLGRDGSLSRPLDLVEQCLEEWRTFFKKNGIAEP
jgi:hypothetical protein